jgi:hypothetical protein
VAELVGHREPDQSLGDVRRADSEGPPVFAILEPVGAILELFSLWLLVCDVENEFAPWILGASLPLLLIGHFS